MKLFASEDDETIDLGYVIKAKISVLLAMN